MGRPIGNSAGESGASLHIISQDGDFVGELEREEIHSYLNFEWAKKKGGRVKLWRRASQFLAAHFPDAKNAIEIERTFLIERSNDRTAGKEPKLSQQHIASLQSFQIFHS